MKNYKNILNIFAICFSLVLSAQQTPGDAQKSTILIQNVTAHIGDGTVIENAAIGFDQGKISYVGTSSEAPSGYQEIIDAQGQHVYPGFIAPNSTLGLVEIDAVKATDDEAEMGSFNPNIRAIVAYNAESRVVESVRPNGVLMAQITPRGGVFAGNSSIVQLDAWNYEDATLVYDDGNHIYWPSTHSYSYRSGTVRTNKNYAKQVDNIENNLRTAKVYLADEHEQVDLKLKALKNAFAGSQKIYIHTNGAKEMLDAMRVMQNFDLNNYVFVGAYEANKIIDQLKENNVPILIKRVHSLPNSVDQDVRLPFKVAAQLVQAGITVGLENTGAMERMQTRNLPFYAGTTVGYGISYEQALQTITSNTAKILGIDAFCGTLEVGKDATLFVSKGNALEMRGNQLTHCYIQGRQVSLETHQTELYKRYSKKYQTQ
ncbi:MAG: amidohydrolase family protein [Flavobacteriaceae bacterium]